MSDDRVWFPSERSSDEWAGKSQYDLHFNSAKGSDKERASAKAELDRRQIARAFGIANGLSKATQNLKVAIQDSVTDIFTHDDNRHVEIADLADKQYRTAKIQAIASRVVAFATLLLVGVTGFQVWLTSQEPQPSPINISVPAAPPTPVNVTVPPPATIEAIVKTPSINLTIEAPQSQGQK